MAQFKVKQETSS